MQNISETALRIRRGLQSAFGIILIGVVFASGFLCSASADEVGSFDEFCNEAERYTRTLGSLGLSLGQSLDTVEIDFERTDDWHQRKYDGVNIRTYVSVDQFGNFDGMSFETISCEPARELIVGITTNESAKLGTISVPSWKAVVEKAISSQTFIEKSWISVNNNHYFVSLKEKFSAHCDDCPSEMSYVIHQCISSLKDAAQCGAVASRSYILASHNTSLSVGVVE